MSDLTANDGARNADFDWDSFDCNAYVDANYSTISNPDRVILQHLVEIHRRLPSGGNMIEIGAGPNLYPLLAASAYRSSIHVTDVSSSNLLYLQRHIAFGKAIAPWDRWISLIQTLDPKFDNLDSWLKRLDQLCTFELRSIFDLHAGVYDIASMHFVAESMTNDYQEFVRACESAIQCITEDGILVASFMLSSEGYLTGNVEFPAVPIAVEQILELLSSLCRTVDYTVLEGSEYQVRDGHTGILFAHGCR